MLYPGNLIRLKGLIKKMSVRNAQMNLLQTIAGNITEAQMPTSLPPKSVLSAEFEPGYWLVRGTEKLGMSIINENESASDNFVVCRFSPNHNFYMLHGLDMKGRIPSVSVKGEFAMDVRIAWCQYPAHYIMRSMEMFIEGADTVGTLTSNLLTLFSQKGISPEFTETYDTYAGGWEGDEGFSDSLEGFDFCVPLPFGFCLDRRLSLPLFMHRNQPVEFLAEFERTPMHMLRMQKNVNKEWKDILFDSSYLENQVTFSIPTIVGKYANQMGDEVKDRIKPLFPQNGSQKGTPYTLHVLDYKVHELFGKDQEFTRSTTQDLVDDMPTTALFWMVQKYTDYNFNNRALYGSLETGEARITFSKSAVDYVVLRKRDIDMATMAHFHCKPRLPGIGFYSCGVPHNPFGTKPSVTPLNQIESIPFKHLAAKFKVSVEDEGELRKETLARLEGKVEETKEAFYLMYYLQHYKRIIYSGDSGNVKITVMTDGGKRLQDI